MRRWLALLFTKNQSSSRHDGLPNMPRKGRARPSERGTTFGNLLVCAVISGCLLLLTPPVHADDLHLDLIAGYAGTRDLGFEDELAPVLGAAVEWTPSDHWSVSGLWTGRYADKIGAGDSEQTTLELRACWTPRGWLLCGGTWSTSLVTDEWDKVGAGARFSLGYRWTPDDEFFIQTDLAHTPNTNVAPEVSGTTLSLRAQWERWGLLSWATVVEPVDGSLPQDGLESGVALVRRWR